MRVILDTNILFAALITRATPPDRLYEAWRDGRFTLFSSEPQIEEFSRVTRRNGVRFRINPAAWLTTFASWPLRLTTCQT